MIRATVSSFLACLLVSACGGRSSLNDFSEGATDIVRGRPGTPDARGDGGANEPRTADGGTDTPDGAVLSQGQVGDPCESAESCEGRGSTCLQEVKLFGDTFVVEYPGGYCAQADCASDDDCAEGSGCVQALGAPACMKVCETDDDCRAGEGYNCTMTGFQGPSYCLPPFGPGGGPGGGGPFGG